MIHWKNKPITELSETELKVALGQSVTALLNSSPSRNTTDGVWIAFLAGFFAAFVLFSSIALFVA